MNINEIADRLFCAKRLRGDFLSAGQMSTNLNENDPLIYGIERDRFKLSMCAPLRRLQQKTQVYPLDVKVESRNRLTHSLEVQAYTRLIVFEIVKNIKEIDLSSLAGPMISCLYNASLLHDIGNPPFGHFGESLIRAWIKKILNNQNVSSELSDAEKDDLRSFNGNAQGLRVSHSIQDLNLTLGQYASVIKVPYTIKELLLGQGKGSSGNGIQHDFYSWSYANAGVFLSEKYLLDAIRENCRRDTRHPFATIIEYADDLAYVLADLEDAFDRGAIDKHTIYHLCEKIADYPELEELQDILSVDNLRTLFSRSKTEALFYLRDVISYFYIRDFSYAVSNDLDKFLNTGEPEFSFGNYPGITALKMLKDYEFNFVYNHYEVQTLDLMGSCYINGLFSAYENLLGESPSDLKLELYAKGGDPFCIRLASRISTIHKRAYESAMSKGEFSEMYLRLRLLIDYISGMTDTYAKSEYGILNGKL